jgi:hypothetical protein
MRCCWCRACSSAGAELNCEAMGQQGARGSAGALLCLPFAALGDLATGLSGQVTTCCMWLHVGRVRQYQCAARKGL